MSQRVLLTKVMVLNAVRWEIYDRVYAHVSSSGWLIIERENGDQVWLPPQMVHKVAVTL